MGGTDCTTLALQEVVLLCTTALPRLVFTGEDIRRLRGFAMSCHYGMVNAQQSGLHGLGLIAVPVASPAPAPATPTSTPVEGEATERTMAQVAARQWEADRTAKQMTEQVLRSEQVDNKHLFHWFIAAANHGALRHFPELMRPKSGAAARVEHSTNLGEGLTIRLDTQDTTKHGDSLGG